MGAMNPPDSLSVENVQTLRSVRRDIYYHGMIGGGTCLFTTNFSLINLVKAQLNTYMIWLLTTQLNRLRFFSSSQYIIKIQDLDCVVVLCW